MSKTNTGIMLFTSPEAETALQRAFQDAHGRFVKENIREFEELVNAPFSLENGETVRRAETWPSAAITWLLDDVFGWKDVSYLLIQKDRDGKVIMCS